MRYRLKNFLTVICLHIIVWLHRDSNYIAHLKREVPDWLNEEGPNRWIADGTVELLAVLSHQGHSGGSIGFALNFFKTMANFEPWGPLTGEDSEWREVGDGILQNIRCGKVFKDETGAYNIEGRIFHDGDDSHYTGRDSRTPVLFPYMIPKPEIVDTTA